MLGKKITRKEFFWLLKGGAISGLLGGFYMRFFEPQWFEVTDKKVKLSKKKKTFFGEGDPITVLHLTDLHFSDVVSLDFLEKAIDLSLKKKADIAVITGDFITKDIKSDEDFGEYAQILKKLSDQMPCFACVGNHDGGKWAGSTYGYKTFDRVAELLEKAGVKLLFNESELISVRGKKVKVVGVGDIWSSDAKPEKALVHKAKSESEEIDDVVSLVLSHNPDSKTLLKSYEWDLLCCGHTHGGQLVIPIINWRPVLPVRDKSFAEGLLPYDNRWVHISRGVGNLHGMRFNCPPEISYLEIV